MLWLQSNDRFDVLGELDVSTGAFTVRSRSELPGPSSKTAGFFALLQDVVVALYRDGSQLFVRIGEQVVPLTQEVLAEVSGPAKARTLVVRRAGAVVASHKYALDQSQTFDDDPTPFVEDEDFDFGLFVANVSQSEERKTVLLGLA